MQGTAGEGVGMEVAPPAISTGILTHGLCSCQHEADDQEQIGYQEPESGLQHIFYNNEAIKVFDGKGSAGLLSDTKNSEPLIIKAFS